MADALAPLVHGPGDGPLAERLYALPDGATLLLAAGTYPGPIALPHSVTLRALDGLGSVTIVGQRGPAVSVEGGARVCLEQLVLRGPESGAGACVQVYMAAEVEITSCLLSGGRGRGEGGGALDVQQGRVRLRRVRLTRNRAPQGGAIRAAGACAVELDDCLLVDNQAEGVGGGALFASRNATIRAYGCSFVRNRGGLGSAVLAGGGFGGAGAIELANCLWSADSDGDLVAAHQGGTVAMRHCLLPRAVAGDGLALGEEVAARSVDLDPAGDAPFAPRFRGVLVGKGDASLGDGLDVYGRSRGSVWLGAVG